MSRWRFACTLMLAVLSLALLWPMLSAVHPSAWPDRETLHRLGQLAQTTLLLVGLTLFLAVPTGVGLAILLERTDLPGRRVFSLLLVGTLFVPLPLFTSAWQIILAGTWTAGPVWTPWVRGMMSAAWIHALAGLPWIVLLTTWGLRGVEHDLEEDARLLLCPVGVLWHVSIRRCAASIAAGALCVTLQTANEIIVTDVMQVRTVAEEVYTQFVAPEPGIPGDPLERAVSASMGQVLVSLVVVLLLALQAERLVPTAGIQLRPPAQIRLGRWRWPLVILFGGILLVLTAVPVGGLLWRAGLAGLHPTWSLHALGQQMIRTIFADGTRVFVTLGVACLAGLCCSSLALVCCWLARESRWFGLLLLLLLATAWAMPGPVVGLGLKRVFRGLLDMTGWPGLLASVLWHGPSYLPLIWVYVVRFLPLAVAFLWPLIRLLPRELFEAARLEGAGPSHELLRVVTPLLWPAALRAALGVAVLSLGEVSAGKVVSTPGAESYAEMVFTQMHYGVTAELAGQCLLLLAVVLAGALALRASWPLLQGTR
jgi:iron(III) transport system permease protein